MSRPRPSTIGTRAPTPSLCRAGDRVVFYYRVARGAPYEGYVEVDGDGILRVTDRTRTEHTFAVHDLRLLEIWRGDTLLAATLRLPTDPQPTARKVTTTREHEFTQEGDVVEFRRDNGTLATGVFKWNAKAAPTLSLTKRYRGYTMVNINDVHVTRVWRKGILMAEVKPVPIANPPPREHPLPVHHTYLPGDVVDCDDERSFVVRRNLRGVYSLSKGAGHPGIVTEVALDAHDREVHFLSHVSVRRVYREGALVAREDGW